MLSFRSAVFNSLRTLACVCGNPTRGEMRRHGEKGEKKIIVGGESKKVRSGPCGDPFIIEVRTL